MSSNRLVKTLLVVSVKGLVASLDLKASMINSDKVEVRVREEVIQVTFLKNLKSFSGERKEDKGALNSEEGGRQLRKGRMFF